MSKKSKNKVSQQELQRQYDLVVSRMGWLEWLDLKIFCDFDYNVWRQARNYSDTQDIAKVLGKQKVSYL